MDWKHESVEERAERGHSRPPLARMLRIHECLLGGLYPNCRKIAEEFEVSCKTVQRDINFMRDQLRLPIEYDKERFGFHYTRPVQGFPALGEGQRKADGNPWKKSAPAQIGERPALEDGAGNGRGQLVRIRFDADSARTVRARTWHASQIVRLLPDGAVEMTLRVRDEDEIARWVLSWGGHAWVLEPVQVRGRVREIARGIMARH